MNEGHLKREEQESSIKRTLAGIYRKCLDVLLMAVASLSTANPIDMLIENGALTLL